VSRLSLFGKSIPGGGEQRVMLKVCLKQLCIKQRVSTCQMERAREILKSTFGYDKFKSAQEEVRGGGFRGTISRSRSAIAGHPASD
jgi:hypothetical protein